MKQTSHNSLVREQAASSYMACAEPTWAKSIPEIQLLGLIKLSCLLTKTVYLSDVHLGDNMNFYNSFLKNESIGLYHQVMELMNNGIVKIALRNSTFRPNSKLQDYECDNFSDVYNSWLSTDKIDAWINKEIGEQRKKYFQSLDKIKAKNLIRYNYKEIKTSFIELVRTSSYTEKLPWFLNKLEEMKKGNRNEYDAILKRDWFSLSDIYTFFQSHGYSNSHELMLYHGLINEIAYNNNFQTQLIGMNRDEKPVENIFWSEQQDNQQLDVIDKKESSMLSMIIENADDILDAPSLSILGLLSPDEIVQLREMGRQYFELLQLAQDPLYIMSTKDFNTRFYLAISEYWKAIVEYLRITHQSSAQKPSKLGIFFGNLSLPIDTITKETFSFAINVGTNIADSKYPGTKELKEQLDKASKKLFVRFLFWGDTEELKKIKSVIPNRAWFTKSNPMIFKH